VNRLTSETRGAKGLGRSGPGASCSCDSCARDYGLPCLLDRWGAGPDGAGAQPPTAESPLPTARRGGGGATREAQPLFSN
jgi:hypothetical protein